jgi:hypothetical protein
LCCTAPFRLGACLPAVLYPLRHRTALHCTALSGEPAQSLPFICGVHHKLCDAVVQPGTSPIYATRPPPFPSLRAHVVANWYTFCVNFHSRSWTVWASCPILPCCAAVAREPFVRVGIGVEYSTSRRRRCAGFSGIHTQILTYTLPHCWSVLAGLVRVVCRVCSCSAAHVVWDSGVRVHCSAPAYGRNSSVECSAIEVYR